MKYKKKGYISKDFYEIYLLTNAPFRVLFLYELMFGWCL